MTKNLKRIGDQFKDNQKVQLMSYSVTPWIDSVERLKWYADKYQVNDQQWHLLTGVKSEIYQLARQSYFAEEELGYNKDSTEFLHTEHVLLIDPDLHIRGVYNGTVSLETEKMGKDIRTLLINGQ